MSTSPVASSSASTFDLPGLSLQHRGKVRDVYRLPGERLLMIASDRLSAFDVVLPDPIPGKGRILTQLSNHWFGLTEDLCPNHLLATELEGELPDDIDLEPLRERSVIVRALRPVPTEAIARGYLAGSAWKDYQRTGQVGGHRLRPGLREAELLPEPIFTPSTKAAVGEHDQTMSFDELVRLVGGDLAEQLRSVTLDLYAYARRHAAERGILIADTKFEFGLDRDGSLRVMDEMLTPDSSRFWPADEYLPGRSPPSFDKQYVRDHLLRIGWDQQPPGPHLPEEVIAGTQARYAEALRRLRS
ncbi:MAG: phosphoribosylaminoimidazolesuccinocarboxamide synthase [Xanthomonadales bacterium]|nr:phosphoribosylaminoimidazolesuccinocarboxamide synthase [Xanthomonadales bacterium]MCB1641377.1 phosphoribosylaminoimidazolesuccinocarboxamide synthase [Xanthomonadales bacterium]